MELTIEQALQQGVAAHKEGKLQDAERLYRAILQSQLNHPDANHNLGVLAVSVNRADAALPLFKVALEANPEIEQFWLSYIDALIKEKQFDNAKQILEQAKKQGVDGDRLKTFEAQLSPKTEKLEPASLNPPQVLLNSLLGHYQNGRFADAEKLAVEIIQDFPKQQFAWKVLGAVFGATGRTSEAADANQTAVALSPHDAESHSNLGNTLNELGRLDEALASYNQAIALKPDFAEAKHMLAALTGETTETAPRDYVENLFDNYAAKFESHLVDNLEYKTPRVIAEMIVKDSKSDLLGSIMDLGCGTGLFGTEIKEFCEHLEGIDLSEKMLDRAKQKNIYNKLTKQDIFTYLSNESLNFDYFVSTDVFVYVGDLFDIFRLIKSRNKTGGKLAFSIEHYDGDSFFLEQSGRYSHSKKYIESLCKTFGYELRHFETQALRKEKKQYINGGLYLLDF